MKEVLFNLALIDSLKFCQEQNIDCSGTYLYKYPRKYTYALVRNIDGKALVTTSFSKDSVPKHYIHEV